MARFFIDGFESGDFGAWDGTSGPTAGQSIIAAPTGMSGSYAARFDGVPGTGRRLKTLPNWTSIYCACRFMRTGTQNGTISLFGLMKNGNFCSGVELLSTGYIVFQFYNGAILATSSIPTGTINTPYHVQAWVTLHDTTGRVVVKVDDITVIDYTGDTRSPRNETDWDVFAQGIVYSNEVAVFDDVVIDSDSWPGVTRIAGLKPNGAGYSTQWDPSAGSNFDCVDEVPASDSDYVSTNVVDEVDTYALSDLPAEAAVVKCVQVQARAQKEGAATPQNINLAVRTTGGDAYSGDKSLPSSFASLSHIWETNPGTSSPWTVSEVNAMEAGVKSKT